MSNAQQMYSNESLPSRPFQDSHHLAVFNALTAGREGIAAISVFHLGNGDTGRLNTFLKVTQNICSRTGEFQVSA